MHNDSPFNGWFGRHHQRSAFTLIELMIVVVILGILAAIVIAGVSNASATAKLSTTRESLLQMRNQIQFYSAQHHDTLPDAANLATQLISRTDEFGNIGSSEIFRYGPYVSSMPANAYNGQASVKEVAQGSPIIPDGSTGWLYQVNGSSFIIKANLVGNDHENRPFVEY